MGNYRIFVAEDDSIILMGLKMILKHLGHAISYYVDARCRTVAEPVEGGKMRMSSKAFDMAEEN